MRLKLAALLTVICALALSIPAHADTITSEQQLTFWSESDTYAAVSLWNPLPGTLPTAFGQPAVMLAEVGPFTNLSSGDEFFISTSDPAVSTIVAYLISSDLGQFQGLFSGLLFPSGNVLFGFPDKAFGGMLRSSATVDGIVINVGQQTPLGFDVSYGIHGDNLVPEPGTGMTLAVALIIGIGLLWWRRQHTEAGIGFANKS